MTIYITQGNYSQTAMANMVSKPDDREAAVRKLVEAAGGKLLNFYFTFGKYDFMLITEGAEPQGIMSSLAVAAAGGAVTHMSTTIAMTGADAKKAFEKANKMKADYRAPGA